MSIADHSIQNIHFINHSRINYNRIKMTLSEINSSYNGVNDPISIMIVDDHNLVRHGLKQSLNQVDGIQVVAEAKNGRDAVIFAKRYNPDIVIMDISMPELNGVEATRQIIKNYKDTKIIALSVHSEQQYVLSMLKAGAKGYLLKTNIFEQLLNAVERVASGEVFFCPEITEHIVKAFILENSDDNLVYRDLSSREREIFQLVSEGRNCDYIADQLCISKKTVNSHKHNIMKKLGTSNIAQLTKIALKSGITSLDI